MSSYVGIIKSSYQEVLSKLTNVEAGRDHKVGVVFYSLKEEGVRIRADLVAWLLLAKESLAFLLQSSYYQAVDYVSGNVTVKVRSVAWTEFQSVATVEEFTDVSSYVVLYDESASWMVKLVLTDVKDKVV